MDTIRALSRGGKDRLAATSGIVLEGKLAVGPALPPTADAIGVKVELNGELIQDVDLGTLDKPAKRHDGKDAPAAKDRPRKGHIGFQHLSRDNSPVLIRKARIKELK